MTSLPAGWHGIPVPIKNSSSTSTTSTTVPTTIRKKWNSPLANQVPRSKLPSYRSSNLQRNMVRNVLPTQSASSTQNELPKCPPKPSPATMYQAEISKLKKELSIMKAENSILKVKVRRVDDENAQKSRQIEKLQIELKEKQKNETSTNKKSKESELLLLRQKCLRLECALKEFNSRRGTSGRSLKAVGKSNSKTALQNEGGDGDLMQDSLDETFIMEKSTLPAQTTLVRNQSVKSEVSKLRDMIHKLEKQNQDLQLLVKDRGEEIRLLKLQLRKNSSKTSLKSATNSTSAIINVPNKLQERSVAPNPHVPKTTALKDKVQKAPKATELKVHAPKTTEPKVHAPKTTEPKVHALKTTASKTQAPKTTVSKTQVQKATVPKTNGLVLKGVTSTSSQNKSTVSQSTKTQESSPKAQVPKNKKGISSNGIAQQLPNKQVNGFSKVPSTSSKSGSTFVVSKPISIRSRPKAPPGASTEERAEKMRENIAAKKIQRSWRSHQTKQLSNHDLHNTITKAATFIVTSIKHHKMRKDKLHFLGKKNNSSSPRLENEDAIVQAIQAATKNLWVKESSN